MSGDNEETKVEVPLPLPKRLQTGIQRINETKISSKFTMSGATSKANGVGPISLINSGILQKKIALGSTRAVSQNFYMSPKSINERMASKLGKSKEDIIFSRRRSDKRARSNPRKNLKSIYNFMEIMKDDKEEETYNLKMVGTQL